jgi:hypothetical protein
MLVKVSVFVVLLVAPFVVKVMLTVAPVLRITVRPNDTLKLKLLPVLYVPSGWLHEMPVISGARVLMITLREAALGDLLPA